ATARSMASSSQALAVMSVLETVGFAGPAAVTEPGCDNFWRFLWADGGASAPLEAGRAFFDESLQPLGPVLLAIGFHDQLMLETQALGERQFVGGAHRALGIG